MREQVLAAAKRLWPEIDTATVYLARTKRQHVAVVRRKYLNSASIFSDVTPPDLFARLTPLMTTEGYALAWSAEENVLAWREPIELDQGTIKEVLELCR